MYVNPWVALGLLLLIVVGLAAVFSIMLTQHRTICGLITAEQRVVMDKLFPGWWTWLATRMTRSGLFQRRRPEALRAPSEMPDPVSFVSTYE